MKHLLTKLLISFIALAANQALADVYVQAQVDKSRPIYAGSPFAYSIVVANGDPESVDTGPLQSYSPSGPSVQTRTTMTNGRTSSFKILTYELTAPQEGEYNIPPVEVKVQGELYQTNPLTISVVKPGRTKQLEVEANISTRKCYVGQPLIYTLSFYIWTDIVRARQIKDINITVPFFSDDAYQIADIDDPGQTRETALPVNGTQQPVSQQQVMHNNVDCVKVELVKVIIPQKPGTFELSPATVSADIAVGRKQRGRDDFFDGFFGSSYEFQRFASRSEPIKIEVSPLPEQDRPKDFYGLVGEYEITAEASPTKVKVGDPVTLTIHVTGGQYLAPVRWPDLQGIQQMAEGFKIPEERADGEIRDGQKIFTQTIRPTSAQVAEVPKIPLSFFDAQKGKYVTVYSNPVPLDVSETRVVTGADIEGAAETRTGRQIEAVREGLSANYTSTDALVNQRFTPLAAVKGPAFIFLYAVPFLLLAASTAAKAAMSTSPQQKAAARRRAARSKAANAVKQAKAAEKPSQEVLTALKNYVADKFNKPPGSLTAMECRDMLAAETGDQEIAEAYRGVMEQTEAAEYSPAAFSFSPEKEKQILRLLSQLEKKLK